MPQFIPRLELEMKEEKAEAYEPQAMEEPHANGTREKVLW